MGKGPQLSSSRVIAIGRLLLATLFLLAIWIDTHEATSSPESHALLSGYVLFAAAVVILTWDNWWLDAKLAGPAHAVDIGVFTLLVVATEGYASPFFTFFIFLLLAAALRWSWLATALTAMLLSLIYFSAGMVVLGSGGEFDLQPFIVQTSHLIILSLILIWFGATQWRSRFHRQQADLPPQAQGGELPLAPVLAAVTGAVRAGRGAFGWCRNRRPDAGCVIVRDGSDGESELPARALDGLGDRPFLYDLPRDRALRRDARRNLVGFAATDSIRREAAERLGLTAGIAIPIHAQDSHGALFLEGVRGLSTDHLDLAEEIAAEVTRHLQRHALIRAAEENAGARARLSLARDLHDSVVQFLAGAAFRLEAMKRSQAIGRDLEPELNELKQLMLHEQRELRVFITALRSGAQVPYGDLASDLKALAERLSRQWGTACTVTARSAEVEVPTRVYLDLHQIVREAVANAVRHAGAKSVEIKLSAGPDSLHLQVVNDGAALPVRGGRLEVPVSLSERVAQAGGTLDISRGMDVTRLAMTLPIGARE